MKRHDQGYVLLEVMIAIVVLVCGTIAVTESYRYTLGASRQSDELSRAAFLIEGRIGEMEKTGRANLAAGMDAELGPVSWNEMTFDTDRKYWKEHRLVLNWGEGKVRHELELSTILAE